MLKHDLLNVPIDDLVANPWNTNVVSPVNEAKLDESIRRHGLFKPIIVRDGDAGKYEVIGGQHRWEAARRLGMRTVPIIYLGDVALEQAKEISLLDNARYGDDDTLALGELLKSLGDLSELQSFLPYGDDEFASIFSSSIALEELDTLGIDENFETPADAEDEAPAAKPAKTHTIMRFKVSLADAERLTALVASTQKTHSLTAADDLTNAGDALVQLLLAGASAAAPPAALTLDDMSEFEKDLDEATA